MEKVTILALPDSDNPQLRVKHPGAKDYITPGTAEDGKLITGLDENALAINNIEDKALRTKRKAEIKKLREELEGLLGRELDLNSDFWSEFYLVLEDGNELYPDTNPMHRLIMVFLVANKKVAPSLEDIYVEESEFSKCLFYFHREKEEQSKAATKQRAIDKVVGKLNVIADENTKRLIGIYSYLFGYNPGGEVSPDAAYLKIKELLQIKDSEQLKLNLERVTEAIDITPEKLNTKIILDKAIKKRVISSKGNVYRRGDALLGDNYEEALEYLMSPENSAELVSLKKEVDKL